MDAPGPPTLPYADEILTMLPLPCASMARISYFMLSSTPSTFVDQFAERGTHKARQLAQQMMLLIEGCHSLILIHGDTSYAKAAYAAARLLLKSQEDIRSG
jgi:hypothetical protein